MVDSFTSNINLNFGEICPQVPCGGCAPVAAFFLEEGEVIATTYIRPYKVGSGRISFAKRQRDMVCRCLVE